MQIIWQPLINFLVLFYHLLFSNMGLAIIALTAFIRLFLVPLTMPSLRAMQKMREFAPELERLKRKHKGDRTKLMQAQADFYKEKGINPAAGCLPQIVQLVVLIALFQGFFTVFQANGGDITAKLNEVLYPAVRPYLEIEGEVKKTFFSKDLTQPDVIKTPGLPVPLPGPFLILAAIVQFLSSKMMAPQAKVAKKAAHKTPGEMDDMMAGMQQQMLYFFPLLTIFIGYTFPLGLVIYWASFSVFQSVQQYFISGWGGLAPWMGKLGLIKLETNKSK